MSAYTITLAIYYIKMDSDLDQLTRSSDPYTQKVVEKEVTELLKRKCQNLDFKVSREELKLFGLQYGEQYVADPCDDLDRYFDITNGRLLSRTVPTRMALLYLFGSGKQYRPNSAALGVAGEAVAGYCMQKLGYSPLVRPLSMMPDVVLLAQRDKALRLALAEAKASTQKAPSYMLKQKAYQFLVDIKTRTTDSGCHYEGFLICCQFKDGGAVECVCLHVDLERYHRNRGVPTDTLLQFGGLTSYDNPNERLCDIIRLQANISWTADKYLTSLLSEEADLTAMLALLKQGKPPEKLNDVETFITKQAEEIGLNTQWTHGQELVRERKRIREDAISRAIGRYQKPEFDME